MRLNLWFLVLKCVLPHICSPTLLHSIALHALLVFAYPCLIAPLFNKFTLLPEDSPIFPLVKDKAEKADFPLGRIWVVDGSTRSS